jgi:hypothetical protein
MPLKISPFKPDWRGQLVLPLAGAAPRRDARRGGGGVHLAEASLLCSVGSGTVLNALSSAASR